MNTFPLLPITLALALLRVSSACTGQLLTNGDFSDGLTGWTEQMEGSGTPAGSVIARNYGVDVSIPSGVVASPILYQDVDVVAPGDVALTFEATFDGSYTTAYHYVSLKRVDGTSACAMNSQNYFVSPTSGMFTLYWNSLDG